VTRHLAALILAIVAVPAAAWAAPDVVRTSFYVPVRDGTRLAVNVYRPANGERPVAERLPVIFAFTPYRARYLDENGRTVELALNDRLALRSLIGAGYVVATADIRGKGASFGHRRGFQDRTEAQDGYDLVEWLARQDYSTGRVGMIGCSYLGGTTFQTATTAPPSLRAIFVGASDLDKYGFVRRGGITAQFNTRPDEPAEIDLASIPVDDDRDGAQLRQAVAEHAGNTPMAALWYGMSYRDSVSSFTGNAFWDEVAVYRYLAAIRRARIATYFWGNWQDEPTAHSILSAENTGGRFLAGPGSHCVPPPDFDFTGEVRRYFDQHLKGIAPAAGTTPRATYWVEGQGWVRSASLPGARARYQDWLFSGAPSDGARSANHFSLVPSSTAAGQDRFTVDYNLPNADYFAFWARPMDAHGLSYTSAPLERPLRLIGFPIAEIMASVDRPDAHLWVYLDQIDARGEAEVVAFGRLAFSHHRSAPAPFRTLGLTWHSGRARDVAPVTPGAPVAMQIDLTPISRVIPAGARLRVTIAGADPRQRNLAEIRQTPPPVITILRGTARLSRIRLPVSN
jgi:putative CocE/NonD family hydrolase